jgi:transposase
MRAEWRELDRRIAAFDGEFAARARSDEAARLLATIPGIGTLNATALTAAIGSGHAFGRARDLAAWLGLVPCQRRIGSDPVLVEIGNLVLTHPEPRPLFPRAGTRAVSLSLGSPP